MKNTLFKLHFVLLLGLFVASCTKPEPPEPPYVPPKPFDWETYDWKHSFFCHNPITISDSSYFHGFLDGKEVCMVVGKDGYEQGVGGVTTNLGYKLDFGFGHETKDSVCLLYFDTPNLPSFSSVADYFPFFELGELPLSDRTQDGFSLEFEVIYATKEDGNCRYKLFTTWFDNQDGSVLRLVEKKIEETPTAYNFYFKFEIDAILYKPEADSSTHNLQFGHLTNGVLCYKGIIPK